MSFNVTTSRKIKFIENNKSINLARDKYDNFVNIDNADYYLEYLTKGINGSRGGNSNVFLLKDTEEDELFKEEDKVIKICKFSPDLHKSRFYRSRIKRFQREIIANRKAVEKKLKGTIKYFYHGKINVGGYGFTFFVMEKANSDLNTYLTETTIGIQQKLVICHEVVESFIELHNIDLYHRDIKHDNILMKNGVCKIGDLGLYKFKNEDDEDVDQVGERIGAFGWESPETMNKYLTEGKINPEFCHDCDIDDKSDVFQLGKLFWYIFQGNLPIGHIELSDFLPNEAAIFGIIQSMLSYKKESRPSILELQDKLKPIYTEFNVL